MYILSRRGHIILFPAFSIIFPNVPASRRLGLLQIAINEDAVNVNDSTIAIVFLFHFPLAL